MWSPFSSGLQAAGGGRPGQSTVSGPTANPNEGYAGATPDNFTVDTGPQAGLTTGQAQPQFQGLDFTKQGAGESYYGNNQQVWQAPSFGEVNAQGLVGQYSDPNNRPDVANNSQNWFDRYSGQMPSIASDPGLGPYYENAKKRAQESINQATAARGSYGSSSANDQTARAFTDLEADRAQKEAQYNLQRLGEQRQWESLGGQMAGSADSSSRAQSQDEQQWAQLLSSMGLDASQLGLQRTNAGQDAANSAQNAQRARGQDYFNNQMMLGDRVADQYAQFMLPALDNDADLFGAANSGGVAQGNQGLANEQANAATTTDALKTGASIYDKFQNQVR